MKDKSSNLKAALEDYFKKRVGTECSAEFEKLVLYLDNLYKLSNICDFDIDLVLDKEHHNNYYRFIYNTQNTENDFDTTTYIIIAYNNMDSKKLAIVFDQITLGERDYPYGKITTYFFDSSVETRYFDYNQIDDTEKSDSYIKHLIKK